MSEEKERAFSEAPRKARSALQNEIETWIHSAIRRQEHLPFQGGHDEANYAASWVRVYLINGDEQILKFLRQLRDQIIDYPAFYHGFYPSADMDIEHSVENWTGFMSELARAIPDDDRAVGAIEHVMHHVGNWEKGVPEWYDWERRAFCSEYVGTREVKDYPPYDYDTYWNARAGKLALELYALRSDERYLEWAVDYGLGWEAEIMAAEDTGHWLRLPVSDREEIRRLYGDYPENLHTRNVHWIGELMGYFEHLHQATNDARFLEAARKIAEQKSIPMRIPAGEVTSDSAKRDGAGIVTKAKAMLNEPLPSVLLLEGATPYPTRAYAYRDEQDALKDCVVEVPVLLQSFGITGDEAFAIRAMDQARLELFMAGRSLRDGREHGCCGRLLHAAGRQAVDVLEALS